MKNKRIQISLIALATAVILGGCNLLPNAEQEIPQATPVPSTQPEATNEAVEQETLEVHDEVKDGIYTNYTYGFQFQVPDDFSLKPGKNPSKVWIYEPEKKSQLDKAPEYNSASYTLTFSEQNKDVYNLLSKSDLNENISIKHSLFKKISESQGNGYHSIVVKSENNKDTEINWGKSFLVFWAIDGKKVVLLTQSVESSDEEFIQKNQNLLKDINKSFLIVN